MLVGTAHISKLSVDTVETTLRERKPKKVLVELDTARFQALQDPEAWKRTDIFQVIKQKKQHLFLLQLYLAAMQARMGRETGVQPGAEMIRAIEVAEEIGADVVLIDRDVSLTLKRGFGSMGFWARAKLFWKVWTEALFPSDADAAQGAGEAQDTDGSTAQATGARDAASAVDAMLESDAITAMTEEFAQFAPQIKVSLIDERDTYMASHIMEQAALGEGPIVAVVGAGHMPGITRQVKAGAADATRESLDEPPPKRLTVGKVLAFLVPAAILGAFGYMAYTGEFAALRESLKQWILINGTLAALGALLARGHILSALTAFIAAPLTSLNPLLAAGWFAGAAEAKLHTPTVADFEAVRKVETMKDFYRNGVVRILLVTALANVGSMVGTYIAGWKVFEALGVI